MHKRILFGIPVFFLSACQTGPYPITSPHFDIPAGSHLVLKVPLTIPANMSRIYLQNGNVITPSQKDQYEPHCWFLSWKNMKTPQIIKPDTFIITTSRKVEDYVQRDFLRFARVQGGTDSSSGADLPMIEYSTQMSIQSEKQPDIRKFICNHWVQADDARHLTIMEIRTALGNVAELVLK